VGGRVLGRVGVVVGGLKGKGDRRA